MGNKKNKIEDNAPGDSTNAEGNKDGVVLKRELGLLAGVAMIVGSVIGSGIFISPKGVLQATGSVGSSLCVWTGCGVISILGSLCYAELGTLIRMSGADYAYLSAGIGDAVAFINFWTTLLVTRTASMTVICLAFAQYTSAAIFDDCGPPDIIVKLLAALAIVVLAIVNGYSVNFASKVQVIFTFAKLAVLVVIIVGGLVKIGQGYTSTLQTGFEGSETSPAVIAFAFYDGLWAYDGWNQLNFLTEEIKNPKRNLPLALLISLPLIIVVYLLTNISYLTVMTKSELLASDAVGVLWGERVLGPGYLLISIGVALSTFGAANGSLFSSARVNYVAARRGHFPESFSYVSARYMTPLPAVAVTSVLALIFVIPGDIYALIDVLSFTTWVFYLLCFISLIALRFRMPKAERPFKVPIPIPIIMILIALYLIIAPIIEKPQIELLYGLIFMLAGLIFYVPFVYFKVKIPFTQNFECYMQLLMEIVPSKDFDDINEETEDVDNQKRK